MNPRVQDSRVGIFPTYNNSHENGTLPLREVAQKEDGMRKYMLANRWRLEPKDIKAWVRGELVEPVKPIVWYVDDRFSDGVERANQSRHLDLEQGFRENWFQEC